MRLSVVISSGGLQATFLDSTQNPHCPQAQISWTNLYEFWQSYLAPASANTEWKHAEISAKILDQAHPLTFGQTGLGAPAIDDVIAQTSSPRTESSHTTEIDLSTMHTVHYERVTSYATDNIRLVENTVLAEMKGYVHGLCVAGVSTETKAAGRLVRTLDSRAMCIWNDGYVTYLNDEYGPPKLKIQTPHPLLCAYSPPNLVIANQEGLGELSNVVDTAKRQWVNYDQLGHLLVHQTVDNSLWQVLESGLILEFASNLDLKSVYRCQGPIDALVHDHHGSTYICIKTAALETQIVHFCRSNGVLSYTNHIRGRYIDFTEGQNGDLLFLFETSDGLSILSRSGLQDRHQTLTRIKGITEASSISNVGDHILLVDNETHWLWDRATRTCTPYWRTVGHRGQCPPLHAHGLCFTIGHCLEIRSLANGHILCRLELNLGEPDAWCIDTQGDIFLCYGRDLERIRRRGYIGLLVDTN